MVLIGVPDVKDVHVQLPLDVIDPLAIILPGHLEQHVIFVYLPNNVNEFLGSLVLGHKLDSSRYLSLVMLKLLLQGSQFLTVQATFLSLNKIKDDVHNFC